MIRRQKDGFTLVELMVALALSGLVIAAVYKTLSSQQRVYTAQEQVVSTQQELRAGMEYVVRDLRMSGYNPHSIESTFGISAVTADSITFATDYDGDGIRNVTPPTVKTDPKVELISYICSSAGLERRENNVAYSDATPSTYGYLLADNVVALDLVYLDRNGAVLALPLTSSTQIASITAVQITMVVRAGTKEKGFKDTTQYKNQQNTVVFTPATAPDPDEVNRRHRLLTTTVWLRN
ncbi:MAG TPA: prepilin-type N-terminal cleavage/methylation domain-containing protein [Syntrophobacter fumaroxidans]|mgnify:CR=1 FL=1|nr:prepilin-type N-terminal cleavage/methylation domain-containing protein [Syntrophobacter fumaroxidans]